MFAADNTLKARCAERASRAGPGVLTWTPLP